MPGLWGCGGQDRDLKKAFCKRNLRPVFALLVALIAATIVWAIVIKPFVKPRSNNQHGYYRVLVALCSEHTGYEKDELHDMFRTKAGLWKTVNGIEVLMSTNEMSVIQMEDLIDCVLRTARQDLELTLPDPTQVAAA